MGLNLNIRRIIFNSVYKHDGQGIARLSHSAVKQIAGRAGRRNSPYPEGLVTCRDPRDLKHIQQCLTEDVASIEKAGLIPTASHLELFGKAIQEYHLGAAAGVDDEKTKPHLHSLLKEFSDMAVVKGDYFLCRQQDMVIVAKWLCQVDLEIKDKFVFCMAPVKTDLPEQRDVMLKFGKKLAAGEVRDC
jgi:ATP-dependent RNA helicase SUPV3L1/SUV3